MSRYDNDRIYADYVFNDETSSSDPLGQWDGNDSYNRDYRCRVPRKMLERATTSGDRSELMTWLERHDYVKEIWR